MQQIRQCYNQFKCGMSFGTFSILVTKLIVSSLSLWSHLLCRMVEVVQVVQALMVATKYLQFVWKALHTLWCDTVNSLRIFKVCLRNTCKLEWIWMCSLSPFRSAGPTQCLYTPYQIVCKSAYSSKHSVHWVPNRIEAWAFANTWFCSFVYLLHHRHKVHTAK